MQLYFAAVVNALDDKECSGCMADIIEDNSLSEDKLSDIVSGMHELLREALRVPPSPVTQEVRLFTCVIKQNVGGKYTDF